MNKSPLGRDLIPPADHLDETVEPQRSQLREELSAFETESRQSSAAESGSAKKTAPNKTRAAGSGLEEFIHRLSDSGLMSAQKIHAFLDGLPPDQRRPSSEQLARLMYQKGLLTRFQAQAVYQGKTRGLVVGNYVVLDRVGQGGMGQVYKARHQKMDRVVALKILPVAATQSADAVKRFQREARAAAKLSHPGIVTAFDADESEGIHFLVMEYVDAKDLTSLVKEQGPLPTAQAVDCVLQAAQALEYAHSQGVIHRDVKPANLLLDRQGRVKILDMGLARVEDAFGAADKGLTHSGQVMGTLDYMAPEQALDARLADARSDIYSLGCTLHYLLTGSVPYRADTVTKKILAHREQPIPSLHAMRPEVPQSLDVIFRGMLAKNADQRPQSMSEVIAALQSCQEAIRVRASAGKTTPRQAVGEQGIPNSPPGAHVDTSPGQGTTDRTSRIREQPPRLPGTLADRHRPWLRRLSPRQQATMAVALGGGFLLVLLGIILKVQTKQGTLIVEVSDPEATIQVLSERGEVTIERKADKGALTIGVDPGKHRLRVKKDDLELFARDFTIDAGGRVVIQASLEPKKRAETADRISALPAANAAVPSASRQADLASQRSGESGKRSDAGEEMILNIGHWSRISDQAVSADGKLAATSTCREAIVWDLEKSQPFRKVSWKSTTSGMSCVAFMPDGKRLLTGQPGNVILWDIASGTELRRFWGHADKYLWSIAISPDGRQIATAGNDALAILWDAETGAQIRRFAGHSRWISTVRFTPDGKRLITGENQSKLVVVWDIATGEQIRQFPVDTRISFAGVSSVDVSPDGRQLVIGTGDRDVIIRDLETGRQIHKFPGSGQGSSRCPVAFSRDGTRVICQSRSREGARVWDARSGEGLQVFSEPGALSPEGDRIFLGGRPPKLCDLQTGREIRHFLAPSAITSASFSPDGRTLALSVEYDNRHSLVLWSLEQGRPLHAIPGRGGRVEFSRRGKRLLVVNDSAATVWNVSGSPDEIARIDNAGAAVFSPDDQFVLVGTSKAAFLWDIATRSQTVNFSVESARERVSTVAFDPSGKYVLAGHYGRQFVVFDAKTGTAVKSHELKDKDGTWSYNYTARFDPSGKAVVIACGCNTLFRWNFEEDTVRKLAGHNESVSSVELSPDGRFLLSGSNGFSSLEDQAILWDSSTGERLATMGGHDNGIAGVAFSSDSRRMATASGPMRIFDRATGNEIARLVYVGGSEDWIVVTPDGRFDASPGARMTVGIRRGAEILSDASSLQRHFVPGLVAKVW